MLNSQLMGYKQHIPTTIVYTYDTQGSQLPASYPYYSSFWCM